MRVKICGITNLEDALLCYNLGADAIGFIFYEKSKRYIKPEEAKLIIQKLPAFVLAVGVFVNERTEKINEIAKEIKLNLIQLHGDETLQDVDIIEFPVIKAFRVDEKFDFNILDQYEKSSILLDTFSNNEYGGTGRQFNWESIPLKLRNKIILSGGVTSENIGEIYSRINPAAIDVSSSLESNPGKKDKEKVRLLFKQLTKLGIK